MHRLIVALLAAVDAAIAAAVGVAAILAPLTLVWVFGFGAAADWSALWPTAAKTWQLGHTVPLAVELPPDYLAQAGISGDAASFTLSLAPLAFAAFTAVFAARSGMRASRADAWITGIVTGSLVFTGLALLVAVTSVTPIAEVDLWRAVLFPALLFAVPALCGAVAAEWTDADAAAIAPDGTAPARGSIARLHARIARARDGWAHVPGLIARGGAVAVVGLVGAGAAVTAVAVALRAGEIVALFESAHVDALGAAVVTLGQLAYLPTVVVWAISFVAGPGFAIGVGTDVSPAGTQVGPVPGIPLLGAVPESTTPWLLLLALVPVALGAFAGWIARSRLVAAETRAEQRHDGVGRERHEPMGARVVVTIGISVAAAGAAALLSVLASGSLGPGALAVMGPDPGPVALAVGVEVLVGASIMLLSPRRRSDGEAGVDRAVGHEADGAFADDQPASPAAAAAPAGDGAEGPASAESGMTAPVD